MQASFAGDAPLRIVLRGKTTLDSTLGLTMKIMAVLKATTVKEVQLRQLLVQSVPIILLWLERVSKTAF